MKITGAGADPASIGTRMPQGGDSVEKGLRSRIDSLKKQLERLSENEKLDPKEKLKRKEELNSQIAELNEQLERRAREKEQKNSEAAQAPAERNFDRFERSDENGMDKALSADISVKQAQTRGNAARALRGKANVLKSEIRQDGSRGASTERKQAELAKLTERAEKAERAQAEETGKASKAAANSKHAEGLGFLTALKKKIPGTEFFIGTVSYGQTYGNSTDNNFVVHPKYLEKLSGDPDEQKKFEEAVRSLNDFSNRFRASQAAQGREVVSEGWFCDEDGNWGGWSVTRPTNQKSH